MTIGTGESAPAAPASSTHTELVVFDFDETIIACDSDTFINILAPGGVIPVDIWNRFLDERDWTAYMEQVFAYLHANGVREQDYQRCLAKVPFVESMDTLLRLLAEPRAGKVKYEVVIISDANTFFIGHALESNKLSHTVKKVFTNPAAFDPSGHLRISRFHEQDWCALSARNLCKGFVLQQYLGERAKAGVTFDRVNYVGDGQNDLCPSLKLSSRDRVFPRAGFPLHKLAAQKQQEKELVATVHPFTTGADIWKVLSQ